MTPQQRWRIHFFQRHKLDDAKRSVPTIDFFEETPGSVVANMQAVLDAVADAPPPAWSGGLQWQAMHGSMKGYYEVRCMGPGKRLYRLYCFLENPAADLGGPSVVAITGLTKPNNSAFSESVYAKVRKLGDEFKQRRTVLE